jgi:hypothetical protein
MRKPLFAHRQVRQLICILHTELVFLNVYGAQESISRMNSASLCSLAGRYDNPIPPWFLASIDSLKIPGPVFVDVYGVDSE